VHERDHRRTTAHQLDDNLKAIDVALTADDMKELDEVSKLTLEYPEWMSVLGTDRKPGRAAVLEEAAQQRRGCKGSAP
jgi:hypothetical protein